MFVSACIQNKIRMRIYPDGTAKAAGELKYKSMEKENAKEGRKTKFQPLFFREFSVFSGSGF